MKIFENFNLTNYNSYGLNSICKTAYFPDNEIDIYELYKVQKSYILIGHGNNIILSKKYYENEFVIYNGNYNDIELDLSNNNIIAEAGVSTKDLCKFALKNSLSGIEFLYDIPSSVGGAITMNAGTKEGETKNVLLKVRYLDLVDLKIKEKFNHELDFRYRNSLFQDKKNKIILKSWFNVSKGIKKDIKSKMENSKSRRWQNQPRNFPNAGSVFKRPEGFYVGEMIDELKLRGLTVGGAMISKKHAGFIINYNNATGEDIIKLISIIKSKIFNHFNVMLEVEQRII